MPCRAAAGDLGSRGAEGPGPCDLRAGALSCRELRKALRLLDLDLTSDQAAAATAANPPPPH